MSSNSERRASSAAPPDARHAAILLAWALVLAYSLAPFDFTLSPRPDEEPPGPTAPAGLAEALDLLRHLLAFVAVGARCTELLHDRRIPSPVFPRRS